MEIKRERALITRLIYFAPSVAGKCDNKRLRRLLKAAKLPVDVYQRQLLKSNRINHKHINLHARINEAKIVLRPNNLIKKVLADYTPSTYGEHRPSVVSL